MTPEKRKPLTRREFTPKTKRAIRARSGGVCEVYLISAEMRKVRYTALPQSCERKAEEIDHIHCAWSDGGTSIDDGADLCRPCHAIKSVTDKKEAAKAARRRGETGQNKRREARGGSSIQNRGFQKPDGYKHKWAKRKVGQ